MVLVTGQEYRVLQTALPRVLRTYELVEAVLETKAETDIDDEQLRQLWRLLKPDVELESIVTKQWQDIGFQ
jgi:hypothetical protein